MSTGLWVILDIPHHAPVPSKPLRKGVHFKQMVKIMNLNQNDFND